MDLADIRKQIDILDEKMLELFEQRLEISELVASAKMQSDDDIYKPQREKEVLENCTSNVSQKNRNAVRSFFTSVMRMSRERQYSIIQAKTGGACRTFFDSARSSKDIDFKNICYFGHPASWSHSAAQKLAPSANLVSVDSFDNIFEAVSSGKYDAGVLPIDNSTAGTVSDVYDLLVSNRLYICRSINLDIEYVLAALPEAKIDKIKHVYSHPQALSQCSDFIKKSCLTPVGAKSTSGAAKMVKESNDLTIAALCPAFACEYYGLTPIKSNIRDINVNTTRFILVSPTPVIDPSHSYISIAFHTPHRSGSLVQILSIFADYGINLSKIHSRPIPDMRWEYCFHLDFEGSFFDPDVLAILMQLERELPFFVILGSFE